MFLKVSKSFRNKRDMAILHVMYCDCCYPNHTVRGKVLVHSAKSIAVSKGTLDDGIKFNSDAKNPIDHVEMGSILRQVFICDFSKRFKLQ